MRQDMSNQSLAEQLANELRRAILRGELPPGASIKERDNAAKLGVSRTPMREAIRILARDGLVSLRPARSPVVVQPSVKDTSDQVVVLLALERLSAELACVHATAAELERIGAIAQRMADAFDLLDPLDMFEIDMSFHMAIAEASHNRELVETHRTYLARLWRSRFLAHMRRRNRTRLVSEHEAIVQALAARDAPATRKAIDAHMWRLADDICAVVAEEQDTRDDTTQERTGGMT